MSQSSSPIADLIHATNVLTVLLYSASLRVNEKGKTYYYDEVNVKRWIADADACDICEGNEEMGWVDDDAVFEGVFGDIDGPEAHPHCLCSLEYSVKRKRVYV